MSITPNRDAALKGIAMMEEAFSRQPPPADHVSAAARQLQIDLTRMVMLFHADMADRDEPDSLSAKWVAAALAPAIASFLLTLSGGDKNKAEFGILDFGMRTIDSARLYLDDGKMVSVGTNATASRPQGRA